MTLNINRLYKNLFRIYVILLAGMLANTLSAQQSTDAKNKLPEGVVAKVNGQEIGQNLVDYLASKNPNANTDKKGPVENNIKNELIRRTLLAQKATEQGIDQEEDFKIELELTRLTMLAAYVVRRQMESAPIEDAQIKARYDQMSQSFKKKEYQSRHILLQTEEEAKAVIGKLQAGEAFSELAKASKDPGSAQNGGSLGWASAETYVPPFAKALRQLKKGEYTTTPVKSDFGYHVIQLENTRETEPPEFEQVKPQIGKQIAQERVGDYIRDLLKNAKIEQ